MACIVSNLLAGRTGVRIAVRSQWQYGVRRGHMAVRLLGLRVRIQLGGWMSVLYRAVKTKEQVWTIKTKTQEKEF